MELVISNATLLADPSTGEVLEDASIHIRDGKFAYAGPKKKPDFSPARTIDAGGKLVMPGFANLHTHIAMNILRGYADDMPLQEWLFNKIFPAEAEMTDDMVYWSSLGALCELVRGGVTCINDMYDHCDAIARAVKQSGIRAVLSRGVVTRGAENWEDKIREAVDFYDSWNGQGRIKVWFSPHGQYTNTEESVRRFAELAKERGTGIHTHVSETLAEHRQCIEETGMTPIAFFAKAGLLDVPFVGAHCVWLTEADMDIMAEKGAVCAACTRSNLKLGSGIAPLRAMDGKGVRIALGTDSAASNNKLSIMSEMTFASYIQKGFHSDPSIFPAKRMLQMACTEGPRALGVGYGTIQEGQDADCILVNDDGWRWSPDYSVSSSLVYAAQDTCVQMTIVGGDILYEKGECRFADEEEVRCRIAEYAEESFSAAGS